MTLEASLVLLLFLYLASRILSCCCSVGLFSSFTQSVTFYSEPSLRIVMLHARWITCVSHVLNLYWVYRQIEQSINLNISVFCASTLRTRHLICSDDGQTFRVSLSSLLFVDRVLRLFTIYNTSILSRNPSRRYKLLCLILYWVLNGWREVG